MTLTDIASQRLRNQQIVETKFKKPQELVSYMVAMQAQEYPMAKWAIGLRIPGLTDADVEKAFNKGDILRTHLMRPTWHFVTPKDIRWLLALSAPRIKAIMKSYNKVLGLDDKTFNRSNDVFFKILEGKQLPREQVRAALEQAGIKAGGNRLPHLLMTAELDGIICSGARQGKHHTYTLLEERVKPAKALTREESVAELTKRYFTTRGPAMIQDFVWWSGLTVKDAKEGIANLGKNFVRETINGNEYIFLPSKNKTNVTSSPRATFLFPDYDEYGISYKNRSALLTNNLNLMTEGGNRAEHYITIDGTAGGTWRQSIKNKEIVIETKLLQKFSKTKKQAVANAVKKYLDFVNNIK